MEKVYIQRIFPPTPPQLAFSKKWQAVKVCEATAKRLDLDRLAAFCFLSKMVGLRLTKPLLRLGLGGGSRRFAAVAARKCRDSDKWSAMTSNKETHCTREKTLL